MSHEENEHLIPTVTSPILITSQTKYIGCIGVKTSMRSLCHRTRSEVAKESINRLCEANNLQRKLDKNRLEHINRMLDEEPNLAHSGTEVQLCVTSTHLNIITREGSQTIIQHEMPNVSFASSGEEDTVDFVAYVAKDSIFGRACFVLECEDDTAKRVLDTIARGFHLRTKQILSSSGTIPRATNYPSHDRLFCLNNASYLTDSVDMGLDSSYQSEREQRTNALIRAALEEESWFHGSYLSREESEKRLKQDGDFLVRENMLDHGHFVLSIQHEGEKLHLLFESISNVITKEMVFDDIIHLVKYHYEGGSPIVADNRIVYLRNGVRRSSRAIK